MEGVRTSSVRAEPRFPGRKDKEGVEDPSSTSRRTTSRRDCHGFPNVGFLRRCDRRRANEGTPSVRGCGLCMDCGGATPSCVRVRTSAHVAALGRRRRRGWRDVGRRIMQGAAPVPSSIVDAPPRQHVHRSPMRFLLPLGSSGPILGRHPLAFLGRPCSPSTQWRLEKRNQKRASWNTFPINEVIFDGERLFLVYQNCLQTFKRSTFSDAHPRNLHVSDFEK
ncbi:hypothetical protein B0H13DRAFT_1905120 [Mycena leptocephala]|nr:hypothetical protein B0H13DRAFT_1905120 [Mycena leptocephala]